MTALADAYLSRRAEGQPEPWTLMGGPTLPETAPAEAQPTLPCSQCAGTGRTFTGRYDGAGPVYVDCDRCEGRRLEPAEAQPEERCPTCGGGGWVGDERSRINCPTCAPFEEPETPTMRAIRRGVDALFNRRSR